MIRLEGRGKGFMFKNTSLTPEFNAFILKFVIFNENKLNVLGVVIVL